MQRGGHGDARLRCRVQCEMSAALQVGLIGLGRMGQIHARILARQVERARLVAVADVDRDRARHTADRLDVPYWHDNPADLLARSDIHAV